VTNSVNLICTDDDIDFDAEIDVDVEDGPGNSFTVDLPVHEKVRINKMVRTELLIGYQQITSSHDVLRDALIE